MQNIDSSKTIWNSYQVILTALTVVVPLIILPHIIVDVFTTPKSLAILLGASAMTGLLCIEAFTGKATPKFDLPLLKSLLVLLIVLNAVSFLYTTNLYFTRKAATLNVSCLLILYFTAVHTDVRKAFRLILATALCGVLVSLIVWLQYADIHLLLSWQKPGAMIAGTLGNSNHVGAYLIFPLFALSAAACLLKGKMRYVFGLLFLFALTAFLFARARSSWVGFFFAFPIFLFIMKDIYGISARRTLAKNRGRLIAAIVLAVVALASFRLISPERFEKTFTCSGVFQANTLMYRFRKYFPPSIWITRQNPLFGSGLWCYRSMVYEAQAEINRRDPSFLGDGLTFKPQRVHNEYLEFLNDVGLVGAAVMALFFLTIMRHGWTVIRNEAFSRNDRVISAAAFCSMIAIMLTALFFFPFRLGTTLFLSALTLGIMEGIHARNHGLVSMKPGQRVENHGLLIGFVLITLAGIIWQEGIRPLKGEMEHYKYKKAYACKNYRDAERHLLRAVEYDPHQSAYQLAASQLYYDIEAVRDYTKSLFHAEKAIMDFNGDITLWTAYRAKGLVKYRTGVLLEAKLAFAKALYYNPNYEKAAWNLEDVNRTIFQYTNSRETQSDKP